MAGFDARSLTDDERAFLAALSDLGVEFMVVGMSAALLQGARGATEDIDLWFRDLDDPRIGDAARRAGGFFVTRASPPLLGGMGDRFDVVMNMSGLPDFALEYAASSEVSLDDVAVRVLPLSRIIASKRAANRTKDLAVLPALELALTVIEKVKP